MQREAVEPTPRKAMTPRRKLEIFNQADGRCQCGCGFKLQPDWQAEHRLPLWLGGADDLTNMEAWNKACHARKTSGEATDRAKVYRIIKKGDPETRKPPTLKSRNEWPAKGSVKIQSRGFPKRSDRENDR